MAGSAAHPLPQRDGLGSSYAALKQRVRELREAERAGKQAPHDSGVEYLLAAEASQDGAFARRGHAGSSNRGNYVGTERRGSGADAGGNETRSGSRPPQSVHELFASQKHRIAELESRCASLEDRLADAVARHARQRAQHEKEAAAWSRRQAAAAKQAESAEAAAMEMVAAAKVEAEDRVAAERARGEEAMRRQALAAAEREENHTFAMDELRSTMQTSDDAHETEVQALKARIAELTMAHTSSSAESTALAEKLEAVTRVADERGTEVATLKSRVENLATAARHASSKHDAALSSLSDEHADAVHELRAAHDAELDMVAAKVKRVLREKESQCQELREELRAARQCIRDTETLLDS